LVKPAEFYGFGETDEKGMETLCLTVQDLFMGLETDPDFLQKLIADKIVGK
jgi:hypothetical protein